MNDYSRLLKVLYKNKNSIEKDSVKGKRRLPQKTVMMLSMLPLVLLICAFLAFVALIIPDTATFAGLVNVLVSAIQGMLLFLMISTVLQNLYAAEDNAFLAALPMRSISVFFAKFTFVYIDALKMSAVFLVPVLFTVSVSFAASGHYLFPGFYPLIILITAFAPLLPLLVVTLLSMPVMWLSSFLKGRGALKTVFSILFYVILMTGYVAIIFLFNYNAGNIAAGGEISGAVSSALQTFATVMYPNKVMIEMCLGINADVNFGIFAAIWVGAGALSTVLSLLFYKRVTSRQIESNKVTSKRAVSYKRKSLIRTLVIKDFKSVMRTPSIAMGCFGNIIITPIFIVMIYFISAAGAETGGSPLMAQLMNLGFIMMYSTIFFGGANITAVQAYTREGMSFFISKPLPIPAKQSVTAKLIMSVTPPAVCTVIIFFLGLFLFKINFVNMLLCVINIMLITLGSCALNIYFDMRRGNVNWKTPADLKAASNGFNFDTMFPVLIAIIPGIAFLIMGFMLGTLERIIGNLGVLGIFWGAGFIVAVLFDIIGLYILYNKGVPLYSKIGENKKTSAAGKRDIFGKNNGMLG